MYNIYLQALPRDTYNGRPFVVLMSEAAPAVVAPGRGGSSWKKARLLSSSLIGLQTDKQSGKTSADRRIAFIRRAIG